MEDNDTLLGRKTKRNDIISVDDINEIDLINKIKKSKEMFDEFLKGQSKLTDLQNFHLLEKIIEINEVEPDYNYEFLKLQKKLNIKSEGGYTYHQNLKQLGKALSNNKYLELTKQEQNNPSKEIYNLLILYLNSPDLFDKETMNIKGYLYNMPLIASVERLRMNYYLGLFQNYTNKLTKEQLSFVSKNKLPKTEGEKKAYKIFQEYNSIKNGINKFSEIIKKMEGYFENINLDEKEFNFKIYLFILYVTKIIDYVDEQSGKDSLIINLYKKELDPLFDIKELQIIENNHIYKKDNIGIMKINEEKNDYLIYNNYEKIVFDGKNYVLSNLIKDFDEHRITPINYLLDRNKSLDYFLKTNLNFINDEEIYNDLMQYFKDFVKSKCMKEFIEKNKQYKNLSKLINNDKIIENFLNNKYLKSAPLFDFGPIGYTNKDILIYLIIGIPLLLENYKINNIKEYNNIKNIIFLFNVGMKFIILLHEITKKK